jgi:hypothetical protein
MKSIQDCEARLVEIRQRIECLPQELRLHNSDRDRVSRLAEELALLLHESRIIATAVAYHKRVTAELLTAKCAGIQ